MRFLEITAFIALSGALHAATLVVVPVQPGGGGGGAGGASDVTLQAATPTLAALVRDWDRPPEVSDAPLLTAPAIAPMPDRPAPDTPVSEPPDPAALPEPLPAPSRPAAETRLPAPRVPLAQTTPDTLPRPDLPTRAVQPMAQSQEPARENAPTLQRISPDTNDLPQVDTAPVASAEAPRDSLRPEMRPDRPVRQAAPPTETSTARAAQKAKESGASSAAPSAPVRAAPAANGPSQSQLAQLERQWGGRINAALRRAYRSPRGARGTVKLILSITPAGQVAGVSLAASSGNSRLDQAALTAVKRARFPKAPDGLTKQTYRFSQALTATR